MLVLSKKNILLPSLNGKKSMHILKDFSGEIPDEYTKSNYFQALLNDGKIVVLQKSEKPKAKK